MLPLQLYVDRNFLQPEGGRDELPHLVSRHGVVVLSGLKLSNTDLTRLAIICGTLEHLTIPSESVPGFPWIRRQSNLPGRGVARSGEYWHSDHALRAVPTDITFLYCDRAPMIGGGTQFADARSAYFALSSDDRERVSVAMGWYPCRSIAERDMVRAGVLEEDRRVRLETLQDLALPIVRRHPRTGDPALHLNEVWLSGIDGDADGALLRRLYDSLCAPSHFYEHVWSAHDLVVWDNFVTLHRAIPVGPSSTKETRRITVCEAWTD